MAEALWVDQIRERTLVERQVLGARMAQAATDEYDLDALPDVDKALELFYEFLHSEIETSDDLTPEDAQRLAVGLGRKR